MANFTPTLGDYTELKPFRFWCQKVLPLVYDDSLSYYELLCKVVDYLNKTMEDVDTMHTDVVNLHNAYVQLQGFVNDYFDNLDVQEEINNKLDAMAQDGSLSAVILPLIPDVVTEWMDEHLTPTTPVIDDTLSVSGAGADAKVTGDNFGKEYQNTKMYNKNDYVLREGNIKKAITNIDSPEIYDSAKWISADLASNLGREENKLISLQKNSYNRIYLSKEYVYQDGNYMDDSGLHFTAEHCVLCIRDTTIKTIRIPRLNLSSLAHIPTVIFKNNNTILLQCYASTTEQTTFEAPDNYTEMYINWWNANTSTIAFFYIDAKYCIEAAHESDIIDLVNITAIETYTETPLTLNGYLSGAAFIEDQSGTWVSSDYINIDKTNTPIWLYQRLYGQNPGQPSVTNVCFFDTNDKLLSFTYIETITGNVPEEYDVSIIVPATAVKFRYCTASQYKQKAKIIIYKNNNYVLADNLNIFNSKYIVDIAKLFTTQNGYLDANGDFHSIPDASWSTVTDYIDCSTFDYVKYGLQGGSGASVIALYDKNQRVIKTVVPTTAEERIFAEGVLDISDASYIRICQTYTRDPAFRTYCKMYASKNSVTPMTYHHCVNKPYSFNNKHAYFFGDSITKGFTSGETITQNSYPKLFCDAVNMTFDNYAIGGATITPVSGYSSILAQIQNKTLSNADIIFVGGGINDWQLGVSLSDFRTAITAICEYLSNHYTGEVIFISPINEGGYKTIVTPVASIKEYTDIMAEVVTNYEYSFINGSMFNFPDRNSNTEFITAMFGDRLHPSEKGYRIYAKMLKTILN